jgi:hypothetical protein
LFTAVGFALGVNDKIMGSAGHSSSLNSEFFTGTEFDTNFQTVDGNAILNDCGTKRLPRYLTTYFFIIASPNVRGGETLGFGKGPLQGFIGCLSAFPHVIA